MLYLFHLNFEDLLKWYQKKIGTYDKPQWEKHVELRALRGLENLPRKSARVRTELIDVDLVRGSTFVKPKPHHSFYESLSSGLCHGLLLPYYWKWWMKETSSFIFKILLAMYSLQMLSFLLYIFLQFTTVDCGFKIVTFIEAVIPMIMMLILSILHSQIAVIQSSRCTPLSFRHGRARKKPHSVEENPKIKTNYALLKSGYKNNFLKRKGLAGYRSLSADNSRITGRPSLRASSLDSLVLRLPSHSDSELLFHPDKIRICHQKDEEFSQSTSQVTFQSETELADSLATLRQFSESFNVGCSDVLTDPSCRCKNIFLPLQKERSKESISPEEFFKCQTSNKDLNSSGDTAECYFNHSSCLCDKDYIDSEWNNEVMNNSEECLYSSESSHEVSDTEGNSSLDDPLSWEFFTGYTPVDLRPTSNMYKVSCTIWEANEPQKVDLSALDISSSIMGKADCNLEKTDHFYLGLAISVLVASQPLLSHYMESKELDLKCTLEQLLLFKLEGLNVLIKDIFGHTQWEIVFTVSCVLLRFFWSISFFFLLSVAERTFKQRLQLAKLFSHLTSARKAKKSDIPHFRLNKVRNIKAWLSVRSCLKRHGPQHSVDLIVSATVVISVILLTLLCVNLLKEREKDVLQDVTDIEIGIWLLGLGVYILRFMTIGTKINKKYRNLSTLITEQINLYLQMEQKPHKKDELLLANNVLKLAAELLKELESPFKISGLSANPYLYNITKLLLLSAFSGVLSDLLGFKLKLYKIKLK